MTTTDTLNPSEVTATLTLFDLAEPITQGGSLGIVKVLDQEVLTLSETSVNMTLSQDAAKADIGLELRVEASASEEDDKPQMSLRVEGTFDCAGGPVAGKVCVPLGAKFTVIAVVDTAPAAGYILAQAYIDYDDQGLVQKKTTGPQPLKLVSTNATMIWPDGEAATFLTAQFPAVPATSVGALTQLLPPQPPSFNKGDLFSIELTCTTDQSSSTLTNLPSGDAVAGTSGALFIEHTTGDQIIPSTTGLIVNCNPGPTATPTSTPPPIPRMQKCDQTDNDGDGEKDNPGCSSLVNVFLTRQGAKIPPSACLTTKGTVANVGALAEKLNQEIVSPDPKDPSVFQQLAAFEFEVHYDSNKVCIDINASAAFGGAPIKDQVPGPGICIIEDDQPDSKPQLEGVARIGCVTVGKGHNINELLALATIDVYPQPELYSQAKPNQDNGVVVQINNVNCDLGDEQGHAIPIFSCDD
ncbi:MAG: hypothetical protein J4N98_04600, partial [Chloroflexi bacterium]|nr:hypothetical protein [Chloroflexota bacterium]